MRVDRALARVGRTLACIEPARVRIEPARVRIEPARVRIEPARVRIEPARVRIEPARVRIEPARVRIEPARVRIEPARVRIEPARVRIESVLPPVRLRDVFPRGKRAFGAVPPALSRVPHAFARVRHALARIRRACEKPFAPALRALAILVVASIAAAGDQSIVVGNVRVRVRDPWPESLHKGFLPVLLDFENPLGDARRVEVELSAGYGFESAIVSLSVDVPAGGRESREVFLPVLRMGATDAFANVRCAGEKSYLGSIGASQPASANVRSILYVAAEAPAAGFVEQQSKALSDEGAPRREPVPEQEVRAFTGGPPRASPPDPVEVTFVPHDDLPARFEPYTSADAVVIDARAGVPGPAELDAILAYGRLGGTVAFVGRGASLAAARVSRIAPWLEERFLVDDDEGTRRTLFGQGSLVVSESGLDAPAVQRALNAAIESRPSWSPSAAGTRASGVVLRMEGLELPYRELTLILVLFAIVVGPLNFWLVKRARKPVLLLVTVPVIAAAFSLAIFAYGAIAQGLDVRATAASFALLDQRAHQSSTAEERLLFAGSSAGEGWRFGPGSACLGAAVDVRHPERVDKRVVFDDGVVYSGGYLPVRTPIQQTFVVDRAARERVEIGRDGDRRTAANGLSTQIEALVLHDEDGELWRLAAPLAAGETGVLERAESAEIEPLLVDGILRVVAASARGSHDGLPRGTYVARVSSSPFIDRGGVAYDEVTSSGLLATAGETPRETTWPAHFVVGILDASGGPR